MDSSESISFSMDTTTDSIDVMDHFHPTAAKSRTSARHSPKKHARMLLREHNNETYDEAKGDQGLVLKEPPDKLIVVDETPPPSTASSSSSTSSNLSNSSSQSTTASDCHPASMSQPIMVHCEDTIRQETLQSSSAATTPTKSKKSVLFSNVTVYHFNRSQGFTSIPSQGGSTLGMNQKHFMRRRMKVELYEEVRRRSKREILLKIKMEKRKKEERQRELSERLKVDGSSSSSSASVSVSNTNTSDSDDNEPQPQQQQQQQQQQQHEEAPTQEDSVKVYDEELYSDYSDISDSELEGDSYIFLQPLGVKVRRTLLRASGVGRIDPNEKRECKKIRESRERSGCKCVGRCIPEYCECSRLGVKCHVDRISFPCGCNAVGCRNPEGRTEFDISGVRNHFIEKVIKGEVYTSESPSDAGDMEQTEAPPGVSNFEIC